MTRQTKTMLNALLLEEYKKEHKIPSSLKLGIGLQQATNRARVSRQNIIASYGLVTV